jgi:sigma-B regulation protein RsbU (phosphoserine phosphatase)
MNQGGREPFPRAEPENADFSILVIEDEETNMLLLRAILEQGGFRVASGSSGQEGIEKAKTLRPDLIVLDIMLPDMDGFAVCERLKEDKDAQDIPVIFVTSLDDSENKVRGLSIGGVDYITKPFDAAEITARVRIHLKLRNANRIVIEAQKRRLAALRHAHQSFLTDLGSMPEAKCAVDYESAEEAGGDQYDAIRLGASVYGYFIADIAGHGIESGFHSSVLKALFRENASLLNSPGDTFRRINALMKDYLAEGQHITASYLTINRASGQATLISAGHLPLIVGRSDGSFGLFEAEGDVLGVFGAPMFKTASMDAPPGTRFWMFSDGVVEDFGARQSWKAGFRKLEGILSGLGRLPMHEALLRAREALYSGHPGEDDRVLMVCEA